jgi:type I restriction enzyme, S subunit
MGKRLKDVADVRFSNVDKISRPGETPVRLCNYTDVYNNDYISLDMAFMEATATLTEISKFGLRVGDVLLTKDSETPNDIGIPTVVDETAPDLVCGYHLALIRPNNKLVDSTYLSKQLGHHRIASYFGQQANGSTRYGLSTSSIERVPLELPRIEDQVAIARILRLVDEAIQKTEAVIAKLKKIRAGMLHDLLTYGLDKDGKLRDPIAHPEQFKNSELGRIPKECEVVSLGDALSMQSGDFLSGDRISSDGEYPVYGGNGIRGYTTIFNTEGPLALIGRQGALCGNVLIASGRFYATEHAVVVRPRAEMDVHWLAAYLTSMDLNRYSESSAQPGLSVNKISFRTMLRPQLLEQALIGSALTTFDQNLHAEQTALYKFHMLKAGLMDDLLSGDVPVPENIKQVEEVLNA